MKDERASKESARARARRRYAGLVAQYIHELSQRHASARESTQPRQPREAVT
jgi:hypothetical protein